MLKTTKCLVVGVDGMIGGALFQTLNEQGYDCFGTSRRISSSSGNILPLDLTKNVAEYTVPDSEVVVFCAGITRLQSCYENPQGSRMVNVMGTAEWVKYFHRKGAHVIFLSSNQVFDGQIPFRNEDDEVCPLTIYGRQKAETEGIIKNLNHGWTILRLTKVFGKQPELLVKWINHMNSNDTIPAYDDMTLSPVLLEDVIHGLIDIIHSKTGGILQFSGSDEMSYYQFACQFVSALNGNRERVSRISSLQGGLLSEPQPNHTSLSTARAGTELGWSAKSHDEILKVLIQNMISIGGVRSGQ